MEWLQIITESRSLFLIKFTNENILDKLTIFRSANEYKDR